MDKKMSMGKKMRTLGPELDRQMKLAEQIMQEDQGIPRSLAGLTGDTPVVSRPENVSEPDTHQQ